MATIVQKYGGTSVGSITHIQNVAAHVANCVRQGNKLVVTISAMGEQTDELLALARQLHKKPPRRELDMLMTAGERISASLLAIALDHLGIASVSLTGSQCGILTDETHGNARIKKILGDRIRQGLSDNKVIIVAGFQGVSPITREITTLGRGGTDLSAVAIAAALKAEKCQLYKDVDGVFTTDPRVCKQAKVIRSLSWNSMTSLAWNGANVLHPRSAHLAAKFNIPFEIRSSIHLDREGTLISGETKVESPVVEAMSHKKNQSLFEINVPMASSAKAYAYVVDWLWQQGEAPQFAQLISDSDTSKLSLVMRSDLGEDMISELKKHISACSLAKRTDHLATITVVGQGFQQSPESVVAVADMVSDEVHAFSTTNSVMALCLPEQRLASTVASLHAHFFENKAT